MATRYPRFEEEDVLSGALLSHLAWQDGQDACVAAKTLGRRAASLSRAAEFNIDSGVGKDLFQASFASLVLR